MTDATTYNEEQFIKRNFENTDADAAPATTYVALWTTSPADSPDNANELSGSGYSPQSVDNSSGGWSRAQTGGPTEIENANAIDFGVLDSSTDKTVEGVVVYDGSDTSTANALVKADNLSETITAGNEFKFNAGGLSFKMD
jgi:hypothetical protein